MVGILDIIGPVMVGPSSSHTAGAARLGSIARALLGSEPREASITLYGSFAKTYRGHGTDRAIAAGILGMRPDDPRLRDSLELAREQGVPHHLRDELGGCWASEFGAHEASRPGQCRGRCARLLRRRRAGARHLHRRHGR